VIVAECILLLDTRLGRQNVAHRVGLFDRIQEFSPQPIGDLSLDICEPTVAQSVYLDKFGLAIIKVEVRQQAHDSF
jgi:hypothetical protein